RLRQPAHRLPLPSPGEDAAHLAEVPFAVGIKGLGDQGREAVCAVRFLQRVDADQRVEQQPGPPGCQLEVSGDLVGGRRLLREAGAEAELYSGAEQGGLSVGPQRRPDVSRWLHGYVPAWSSLVRSG